MKKKILSIFLSICLIFNFCSFNVLAFANLEQKSITELLGNSIVLSTNTPVCYVWGEKNYIDKDNLSVTPIIKNDRTLIPIRFVAESLGATVDWDSYNKTATIRLNEDVINITIDLNYMYVNNKKIDLDVPAQIIEDRTLIPLRAISEALDKNIFYYNGFILVSDYDINLDSNNSDVQRMVEYLRYTMLVYETDDSTKISFMDKSVGENCYYAVYADQIPFETESNKLVSVTGGMYIENVKCVDAGNDYYNISMDIYNTSYTYGVVEFYDANGNWYASEKIDMYESIGTSLENTIVNVWEGTFGIGWAIGKGIKGDWSNLQYRNVTLSAHTHINKKVPKGTYLYITNNIKESQYVCMYDMVSIAVDSVSLASDWINTFEGSDKKKFLDSAKENIMNALTDEAFENIITNTKFENIIAIDYSLLSISDYISDVVDKTMTVLSDCNIDISKILKETAADMGKNITVGTAESLLKKAMSFIGTTLNVCFNLKKTANFASFIIDIKKAMDTDPLLLVVGYEEEISYDDQYNQDTKYTIQRDDASWYNEKGELKLSQYYDKIVLEETNDNNIKINNLIQNESNRFLDDSEEAINFTKENLPFNSGEYYSNYSNAIVTNNSDGILSIKNTCLWYMGGVGHISNNGLNYNLNTGDILRLTDVFAMTTYEIEQYFKEQTKKYIEENPDKGWWNDSIQNAVSIVDNYTLSRFNYYIENDNIYLCYPIYELGPGAMGQIVVCCPIINKK